jgi:hypothetical protein
LNLSEQFWLSLLIQLLFGVAIIAMMKQQLRDLVGWVRQINHEVKDLRAAQTKHEGRLSHVEGRLGIPRDVD